MNSLLSCQIQGLTDEILPCNIRRILEKEGFIQWGIDVKDKDGNTALHRALNDGTCDLAYVRFLLQGSNINAKNNLWHTPLHLAIINHCDQYEMIKFLLWNRADPNAADRNGSTALHKCLENPKCSVEIVRLLLKYGARVDLRQFYNETPLMVAIKTPYLSQNFIYMLFYRGCLDLCAKHFQNRKVWCKLTSSYFLVKFIMGYLACMTSSRVYPPAGPQSVENTRNESIIDFSCSDAVCGFQALRGPFVKTTNLATCLLQYAVRAHHFNMDVIRFLLTRYACIYSVNCKNMCAIEYALLNPFCSLELVRELLKYGRKPMLSWDFRKTQMYSNSLLHLAASNRRCSVDIMKELLRNDQGRNLETLNFFQQIPVDCAADFTRSSNCNFDVVETLLLKGSPILKTSVDMTVLYKNIEILRGKKASRKVLDCTKLFVKYALIEGKLPMLTSYTFLMSLYSRYLSQDPHGYFAELNSYQNACNDELLRMTLERFEPSRISLFQVVIRWFAEADEDICQQIFTFLVSDWFPLYRKFMVYHLKKEVLVNNLMAIPIHIIASDNEECKVRLNSYCVGHIASFMENEDLFNFYLAFHT